MTTEQETLVLVRVQARGGKYLGPAVGYSLITISDGEQILFGPVIAKGGSGTVNTQVNSGFPADSSPNAIVVAASTSGPPAGAYWLMPDTESEGPTAGVIASLSLTKPTLLEFRATALTDTKNPVTTSAMMWVYPGQNLTSEPGVLLSMPGLAVSVATAIDLQLTVTATVTMMCGCPITTPTWPQAPGGPEPYWPETAFEVFAVLTLPDGSTINQPLAFTNTSTFEATLPLPPSGLSTIGVCAVQQAESNVGYDEVQLTV
ncbi:MAG TPA: hypothetical protein VGQ76_08665 [Thermoanaerobaculia bacterium]|jgi:hypothetical protein|nr:hypothetical protein [Thermoanaerobaculia bacterium]